MDGVLLTMPRILVLLIVLAISFAMAVTQFLAFKYHWYWTYWWLDILMHIAGGAVVGLSTLAFISRRAAHLVGTALVVGVVWEVYELVIGRSKRDGCAHRVGYHASVAVTITFHRGARRVTGSNFLVTVADGDTTTRVLVDCGLVQGGETCDPVNDDPYARTR
jgi:hypothetical protein